MGFTSRFSLWKCVCLLHLQDKKGWTLVLNFNLLFTFSIWALDITLNGNEHKNYHHPVSCGKNLPLFTLGNFSKQHLLRFHDNVTPKQINERIKLQIFDPLKNVHSVSVHVRLLNQLNIQKRLIGFLYTNELDSKLVIWHWMCKIQTEFSINCFDPSIAVQRLIAIPSDNQIRKPLIRQLNQKLFEKRELLIDTFKRT